MVVFPGVVFGFVPVQHVAFRRNENIYQPPTSSTSTEQRQQHHSNVVQQSRRDASIKTSRHMSSVAVAGMESQGRRRSSFKDRMRNIVVKDKRRSSEAKVGGKNGRPSNVKVVHTLEDYKMAVGDEQDKLVVVRFYATWCKACRAVAPYFYKLAQTYKDIQFVEVPVTDKNANLHQGLKVPSLPYGHIYHPGGGLVEELKINRRHFPKFAKVVHSYAQTTCDLIDGDTTNPYPDPEGKSAGANRSANVSA